jgi:ring-1,2-phenylacetyl-CoA epoxidase subunit PaaD
MEAMDATIERAWSVLEAVPDPEIPVVSIRELGILRDVRQGDDGVLEVVITPTYSGCPAMSQIAEDIAQAIDQAALGAHRIETVLAPAWTTDWITDEARDKLRRYGIAPPSGQCGHAPAESA